MDHFQHARAIFFTQHQPQRMLGRGLCGEQHFNLLLPQPQEQAPPQFDGVNIPSGDQRNERGMVDAGDCLYS